MPTQAPVKTPVEDPEKSPLRRLEPDRICPSQRTRISKTTRRILP